MRWISTMVITACLISSTQAQSPVPIETVASIEDLDALVNKYTESLTKSLADPEKFDSLKDKALWEHFGMLCVIGQSLAEHPESETSKINGPALRDAALEYDRKGNHEEAAAVLKSVQNVIAGTVEGEHEKLHPWNELIEMHPLMEDMNTCLSGSLRVVKRPRGKADEPLSAIAWGLQSIAMKTMTESAGDDADEIAKWEGWSDDLLNASIKLADAIRKKDADEGRKWFDIAHESCNACHKEYRD